MLPGMYEIVSTYGLDGSFRGYAIHKEGTMKLHSINLWAEHEHVDLTDTLNRLNNEGTMRQYWPDASDPDVRTLVDDQDWEPLMLTEEDVVDGDRSTLVDDEYGGIDWEKSNLVYKRAMVPDPTEVQQRVFKAMELVARQRAGLA
jgi:hypothetical protein